MEDLIKSLNGVHKPVVGVKPKPVLLNCSTYALNKSRSKFVSVVSAHALFATMVGLHGLKTDWVAFEEDEGGCSHRYSLSTYSRKTCKVRAQQAKTVSSHVQS